jgi:hypothetical protein
VVVESFEFVESEREPVVACEFKSAAGVNFVATTPESTCEAGSAIDIKVAAS